MLDYADYITQLYHNVLSREPDPSGYQYWLNYATAQNLNPQQLASIFIQAAQPEFDIKVELPQNTPIEQAITQTYQSVLGRKPEEEGFQYWINLAQSQGLSPEEISDAIIKAAHNELSKRAIPMAKEKPFYMHMAPPRTTSFATGAQNVMTGLESLASQILSQLGRYSPPSWATKILKEIAEKPETEQEKFAYEEAKRFFGPLGESPYTLEALRAWEELTRPQIEQAMAIQGTYAPSGAYAETLARARTEATVPLLQQDLQSRLSMLPFIAGIGVSQRERQLQASGMGSQTDLASAQLQLGAASQLAGLGSTLANRFYQSLKDAMNYAGMPRGLAQQQIGSQWDELNRLLGAYSNLYFGPFSGVVSQAGTTTKTSGGGGWGVGK